MIKALVTATTGFIGSHLVKALYQEGYYDVRCLVRKNSKTEALEKLGVEISFGDLLDPSSLEKAVEGVNIIFHSAGEVYSTDPNHHYEVNIKGTKNLFHACINKQINRIIYFSSIAASGPMPNRDILLNESIPCNPINPYGDSKSKTEIMIMQFYRDYKIPFVILRFPIVYGPEINKASRVFMFLHMIKKGLYRVIGNGENIISLCYVDNLIHGVLLAAKNEISIGKIYLIADKRPYTINEIVQEIAKEEKVKLSDIHIPIILAYGMAVVMMMLGKVFNFEPMITINLIKEATSYWGCDISLAQRELNYQPPIEFKEGLKTTVQWYMNQNF